MRSKRGFWLAFGLIATLSFASFMPSATVAAPGSRILDRIKDINPFKGYGVDPRKGRFVEKQVAIRTIPAPVTTAGALGFGALEQGDLQKARLNMPITEGLIATFLTELDSKWTYARYGKLKVYLIASGQYQAIARPDGSMTVALGMLNQAESDDELAFMFSHELMHIRLNHFARDQKVGQMRQIATQANALFTDAVAVSQMRVRSSGDNFNVYTEDQKKVASAASRAAAAKRQMDILLSVLVDTPWARRDEDEADVGGFDIAKMASYSPARVAPIAFGRMKADYDARAEMTKIAKAQLTESVGILSQETLKVLESGSGKISVETIFRESSANMLSNGFGVIVKFFEQKHRLPADRQKGLNNYINVAHGFTKPAPLKAELITKIKSTKEFKDGVIVVTALQKSMTARANGDGPAAVAAMATTRNTQFAAAPTVANESAMAFDAGGNFAAAEAQFILANKSPEQTLDGYSDYIDLLIKVGNYRKAFDVAKAGAVRYKDEKPFLPALLATSFRTGKKDLAATYMSKCMATENASIKNACLLAVTDPRYQKQYDALPAHTRALADSELEKKSSQASVAPGSTLLRALNGLIKGQTDDADTSE